MIQMETVAATSWRAYAAAGRKHDATSADLMVDLYIDPVIERHMNLLTSKTATDWKQALRAFQKCERMEPRDSKRRTPVAAVSSVENDQKRGGDALFETKKKVSSRQLLSKLERMEWNHSSSNSSHVRRAKAPLRNHGIVAYPKEPEMEQATVAARALSQLLASWSSSHVPPLSSHVVPHTVPTPQVVEDVERTLLHCRFSSGGSKKKNGMTLQPRPVPHPNSRSPPFHPPEKTLMEIDAFSSDSSSMSSLSFPELRQALPPALLRVSTSTILEEQDLIWLQIQQDRAKDEAALRRRSASRTKKHVVEGEVTRGSHTRPPLSPPGRIHHHASSSFHTPKSRSFRMEPFTAPSDDGSDARSKGMMMISPPQGGTPDTRTSMASATTGSSSPSASLAKTLAYTGRHSKDPVGTALCLVCHASLTLFRGSTVVYCSQCGTLATTDLLQRRSHNPAEEAAWNAV